MRILLVRRVRAAVLVGSIQETCSALHGNDVDVLLVLADEMPQVIAAAGQVAAGEKGLRERDDNLRLRSVSGAAHVDFRRVRRGLLTLVVIEELILGLVRYHRRCFVHSLELMHSFHTRAVRQVEVEVDRRLAAGGRVGGLDICL